MGESSSILEFSCVQDNCEGKVSINLNTQENFDAWGVCDECGNPYLSESSSSNKRKITEEGDIEEISPDDSVIKMRVTSTVKVGSSMSYELSRLVKRSGTGERISEGLAEAASMSDSLPIPEEVEELLTEASIEVKTVKIAAKTSEPMWRALSNYFGQEVRKVIDEGESN
jgi:hypothetical protein